LRGVAGSLESRAKECSGGYRYSGQERQADESFHNQIFLRPSYLIAFWKLWQGLLFIHRI